MAKREKQTSMDVLDGALDKLGSIGKRPQVWLYALKKDKDDVRCMKYEIRAGGNVLPDYYARLKEIYLGPEGKLASFEEVVPYDGDWASHIIFAIDKENPLIAHAWQAWAEAEERDERTWVASLGPTDLRKVSGVSITWHWDGHDAAIFSAESAITILKFAFSLDNHKFKPINGSIVTLPLRIDAVFVDGKLYFLTKHVFNQLEDGRQVAAHAKTLVETIGQRGLLSDLETFRKTALKKKNAVRLLRFNSDKLDMLADNGKGGKDLRKLFKISFKHGKLETGTPEASERLIMVLSDRGMQDPFTQDAQKVSAARKWFGGEA